MAEKKANLEALVMRLLQEKSQINIQDVAQVAGLSKFDEGDRKTIRRVINKLIDRGLIEVKGAARARAYVLKKIAQPEILSSDKVFILPFKDIFLSEASESVLRYVSQSLQARTPVGYNQEFLRSYVPNRTFYLTEDQRGELLKIGTVENRTQPPGTFARNILNRLLIDLSWNSSRLEGNTYSLLETKRLIELGESVAGKDAAEAQMILNHKGAIEYIIELATEITITAHQICSIHSLLSENLLGDPSASGRIRRIAGGIGGSNYLPLENPHILEECFQLFIEKLNLIEDPFESSFFSLVHLSYLQSFEDVNKRTARVLANIPLIKGNLKPLSFTDVDKEAYVKSLLGVYEKNDVCLFRDLFLWAYARSSHRYTAIQQSMGEPNLLKLQYRKEIQEIMRSLIVEKTPGFGLVGKIQRLIELKNLPEKDAPEIFNLIETEVISLHEGNIARFKIRPSEFQEWKNLQ